jgi:glyoxylase-like metal-dependent hydrolase (beta-lactamase superfamily II)
MKKIFLVLAASSLLAASDSTFAASPARGSTQVCWVETSAAPLDAAMGGNGIRKTRVWNSTISGVLVRHAKGDVLIDTGFSPNAEAQMNELPDAARAFGLQIVSGAKNRKPLVDRLSTVGEGPADVARILITHAHYDHLGGAVELAAPIYVAPAEAAWMAHQAKQPTITPPSLVAAVQPRVKSLSYDAGPYLGFDSSDDIYGDGTIVVVPLPGHTPGSQGVFLKLGQRRVFLIGDAADLLEAAVRGLPKSPPIRAATDFEPELADAQTKRISNFHRAHPEIALVPAHDRAAYVAAFGSPSTCVSSFKASSQ